VHQQIQWTGSTHAQGTLEGTMPRDIKAFESPCRATAVMLKLATSTQLHLVSRHYHCLLLSSLTSMAHPCICTRAVTTSHFKLCTRTSEIQCILLASHSPAGPYIDRKQSPFLHLLCCNILAFVRLFGSLPPQFQNSIHPRLVAISSISCVLLLDLSARGWL